MFLFKSEDVYACVFFKTSTWVYGLALLNIMYCLSTVFMTVIQMFKMEKKSYANL